MTARQLLRHRLCKRIRKMRDPRFADVAPFWSGSLCPVDPDNYWIDDLTGERIGAVNMMGLTDGEVYDG